MILRLYINLIQQLQQQKIYFLFHFNKNQMAYYYSRIQQDLQRSRRHAQDKQIQLRRSRRIQQTLDVEEQLRRLSTAEKLRADISYEEYLIRRENQKQQLEAQMLRQRIIREQQLKQQEIIIEAERRSRIIREDQLEKRRLIIEAEDRKRVQFLAASRRIQHQKKLKIQDEITRENMIIKQQQLQQQKLEAQLRSIDIQIGSIHDQREERRKAQLLQLEGLDEKIFKIKQQMRGSKVKQAALQDSLNVLSKIIVPGAR